MSDALAAARPRLSAGSLLNYLTLAYNTVEAIVAIAAGLVAGAWRSSASGWTAGSR